VSQPPALKVVHTDLNKGSTGWPGVLMQSIAQISPTLAILFHDCLLTPVSRENDACGIQQIRPADSRV
jgi:hypothetical protein